MNPRAKAWLALVFHSVAMVLLVAGAVSLWDRDQTMAVVTGFAACVAGVRAQSAWDRV